MPFLHFNQRLIHTSLSLFTLRWRGKSLQVNSNGCFKAVGVSFVVSKWRCNDMLSCVSPGFSWCTILTKKMSQFQLILPLWSLVYLREFLWNTLNEFPNFLLFNLQYESLISSDLQWVTENCFCSTTSNFAQKFTPENNFEELSGELNTININL